MVSMGASELVQKVAYAHPVPGYSKNYLEVSLILLLFELGFLHALFDSIYLNVLSCHVV